MSRNRDVLTPERVGGRYLNLVRHDRSTTPTCGQAAYMSVCPHRDAFIPLTLDLPAWQRVDTARWGEAAAFADRCLRGTERIAKQLPYWLSPRLPRELNPDQRVVTGMLRPGTASPPHVFRYQEISLSGGGHANRCKRQTRPSSVSSGREFAFGRRFAGYRQVAIACLGSAGWDGLCLGNTGVARSAPPVMQLTCVNVQCERWSACARPCLNGDVHG